MLACLFACLHISCFRVVLPECGARASELFKEVGVPVTFNTYERMAHSSCGPQMAELKDWVQGVFKM